ncbi:MAG: hypothetical protein E7273_03055 [Pseudobutyrivibrio ruminis]|nr:hypothetical protein [Pseudobutyrivibrio ruminis]
MTQGKLIYVDKNKVFHGTGIFGYDMYPNDYKGYGDDIITCFTYTADWNEDMFYEFVKTLHKKNFKDMDYDYEDSMYFGYSINGCYDIRNNWIDYIYLINDSGDSIKCITENGEKSIPKDSLCVISFQNVKEIYNHVKEPFKIEFNERSLNIIIDALDFYTRMYLGQYDSIDRMLKMYYFDSEYDFTRRELYTAARSIMFKNTDIEYWGLDGSLGIYTDITDMRGKNAYDIKQCIRHSFAWCKRPEGGHAVDFDPPLISGNIGEVKCESAETKGEVITTAYLAGEQVLIIMHAIKIFILLLNIDIAGVFREYTDSEVVEEIIKVAEKLYDRRKIKENYPKDFMLDIEELRIYIIGNSKKE